MGLCRTETPNHTSTHGGIFYAIWPREHFIFHHRKQQGRSLARAGTLRGKAKEEEEKEEKDELQLYRYKWHPYRGRKTALHGGERKR